VSALLLHRQGHQVIGAMMRFWPDQRTDSTFETCCSPDAAYQARRVARQVGIPFYLLDYREVFDRSIRRPFLEAYREGKTPNPCVRCNTFVKFGALLEQARALGCDAVATGHYVRHRDAFGTPGLFRGSDSAKDQSYFLWGTPGDAAARLIFPVGHLRKAQVRELALDAGLITAGKPESQDICFVPGALREYLSSELGHAPGPIRDLASGEVLGQHQGVQFYTIGQKRGLGLTRSDQERYVVRIDAEARTLWVGAAQDCLSDRLTAEQANWLLDPEDLPESLEAQLRYRSSAVRARLYAVQKDSFTLQLAEPQFAVTPGQSVVLYQGDRLLGGGVIA
jgi:tRNA-specific 2-thiouridylase